MTQCSYIKRLTKLFSKAPEKRVTAEEHAARIRAAVPGACVDYDGLERLKVLVAQYATQNTELFNAINKLLPNSPPKSPSDFEWLFNFCDSIESGASEAEVLEVAKMAGY